MSAINRASLATGLGLTAFLCGCAMPEGSFPSLARRSYEIDGPNVEPADPVTAAPNELTPELAARIKALTDRHDSASARFDRDLPRVRAIAAGAAGTAPGSERWVDAHMQLSRLDHMRADSVAALGEIDELIAAQNEEDASYVPLLVAIQERVGKKVAEQRGAVEQMAQQIGE